MASFGRFVYNTVFRRASTTFVAVLVGAFVFERFMIDGVDAFWDRRNYGVSWIT